LSGSAAPPPLPQTVGVRPARLEAFSDGVFAIAATLLVLELRVPRGVGDLAQTLLDAWPAYAAYLVSFLTIGIIWVNHHTLLEHIRRVDRPFLYLNVLLLLWVAIVPFPTSVLDEYLLSDRGATVAAVLYGAVGLLIAVAFSAIFFYERRVGCSRSASPPTRQGSRSRSSHRSLASRSTDLRRSSTPSRSSRRRRSVSRPSESDRARGPGSRTR